MNPVQNILFPHFTGTAVLRQISTTVQKFWSHNKEGIKYEMAKHSGSTGRLDFEIGVKERQVW